MFAKAVTLPPKFYRESADGHTNVGKFPKSIGTKNQQRRKNQRQAGTLQKTTNSAAPTQQCTTENSITGSNSTTIF